MPRRASSKTHPAAIGGAAAALIALIFGGKFLLSKKPEASVEGPALTIDQYLENGNSLRGNEYVVTGEVDEKLEWTSDRGQLVSVKVDTPEGAQYIGIEIPPEFNRLNMDTRQSYSFRVKFRQGGIAVATAVKRL
jgi:hypothetical protein